MGAQLFKAVKKQYNSVGQNCDYEKFCEITEKIINKPIDFYQTFFIAILDFNGDGKICDWDIFQAL